MQSASKKSSFVLFPWLLVGYGICIYLSMDAYVPALPRISHVLNISPNLAQWTATVWMLGGLFMQPILGPASDHLGRRPILFFGAVMFVIGSFVCAFSPNIQMLLLGRFIQGMGLPTLFVCGFAAVNEYFQTQRAIQIMAQMNATTILAPALGPLLGSFILHFGDWHWIFVMLGMLGIAVTIAMYLKMPETHAPDKRPERFNLKVSLISYGNVLSNFSFMSSAVTAFFPIVGFIAWLLAGPFIVVREFHLPSYAFGIVQIFIFSSYIAAMRVVDKCATEETNHRFVALGLSLGVIGAVFAFLMSLVFPAKLYMSIVGVVILMFGSGLSTPILSRLTIEKSNEGMGVRSAVIAMVRTLSSILGAVSVAIIYNGHMYSMTAIMLLFAAIAGLLFIFFRRNGEG